MNTPHHHPPHPPNPALPLHARPAMRQTLAVRCAFTLVELIVVISIIALLMAFLLPALSAARDQALQIRCLSNLRQNGIAHAAYAADSHGYYPRFGGALYDSRNRFIQSDNLNPNSTGRIDPANNPNDDTSSAADYFTTYLGGERADDPSSNDPPLAKNTARAGY